MKRRIEGKKLLIKEIKRQFGYKYDDAEKYAEYLVKKGLKEYEILKESTITKEK